MSASESFGAAKPSELVRFALAWAPFEDPVEEIYLTFTKGCAAPRATTTQDA